MYDSFADFLRERAVSASPPLPLLHTTEAGRLRSLLKSDEIKPTYCDLFKEDLSYFFVGRPAYKTAKHDGAGQPEVWQLPMCFIFEFDVISAPRRVLPFDSGAFKKGRMPPYIDMFPIEYYEAVGVVDAPQKIIGSYFSTTSEYMNGNAKNQFDFRKEFDLTALDSELMALHSLAIDKHNENVDDRRITVEVQSSFPIQLKVKKPKAVIVPAEFAEHHAVIEHIANVWGARMRNYNHSTLRASDYYGQIYDHVFQLYSEFGLL